MKLTFNIPDAAAQEAKDAGVDLAKLNGLTLRVIQEDEGVLILEIADPNHPMYENFCINLSEDLDEDFDEGDLDEDFDDEDDD